MLILQGLRFLNAEHVERGKNVPHVLKCCCVHKLDESLLGLATAFVDAGVS